MVNVRRDTRITRGDGETREAGEGDTEPEDEGVPPTSIEDLTQETEPERFDRTFLSSGADLTIDGDFDPVAGPKQVLPRMAYVLSLQYNYNPERDRWEPAEGNGKAEETDSEEPVERPPAGAQPRVSVETNRVSPNTGQQPSTDVTVS